ncbi:MAG TPA: LLM class flavin-dependent oxidoreductase [Chloroflexota bacterium]|jgi:5,10-methylenetetrahydromethanopterin reductase|nr:LLM class flavin-dependent oxidoreductase [Chloroflexota bacterium]
MPVGIISHLPNVTFDQVRALARAAEAAGADWLGLPDAFWWRDTWLLLAEAARVTEQIEIGPMVTNPYLRHPFHTAAALASLQELAGERVFIGIGAGGSEVSGAAGVSRRDAPARVAALATLLRDVAHGQPLDPASGRGLEVPLRPLPILIAGRGNGILRAAGAAGDRALLWAVPRSDLQRSADLIARGAADAGGRQPELVWAPLVDHGGESRERVRTIAAYSVLNSRPQVQASWGVDAETIGRLRQLLVGGGAAAARDLVPAAALDDLIVQDPASASVRQIARSLGATSLALPAFSIDEVSERVAWAREVLR